MPWAIAGVFALAAAALALVHFRELSPAPRQVFEYTIDTPPKARVTNFALSPDGRYLAVVAGGERGPQIWVRPLDLLQWQLLAGTDGAAFPFWSPDSRYVGFFTTDKLKKIAIGGGPAQTLCDALGGRGGTWNQEGVIVFGNVTGSLLRVSAAGGIPAKLTESAADRFPKFLPDGRRFLYIDPVGANVSTFLGSLDTKPGSPHLLPIASDFGNNDYVPPSNAGAPGYLLLIRAQTLMAQPVSPDTLEPSGEAFPIAEQVSTVPGAGYYLYSASRNGIIAYMAGTPNLRQHALFDRHGKQIAAIGAPANTEGRVALSPDEKHMISESASAGMADLWITELERGTQSRFTFDSGNIAPVWSPDGSSVVFASNRGAGGADVQVYQKLANQTGQDELVVRSENLQIPSDFTHDGRFVIVRQSSPRTGYDVFAIPMSGDKKPIPLVQTRFNEMEGVVSPDGRWLAYASDESGHYEIYVQPFAPGGSKAPSGKWQISLGGGRDPHWRGDSRELFYVSADRKMTAVEVKTSGGGFAPGTPSALFEARIFTEGTISRYAVSADGQRFLMAADPEASTEAPIHITVNWLAAVKK
jgi:eukaryotic-like serine/threonine-protein kinase